MTDWTPPSKIEDLYKNADGNKFASINAPTAGARDDVELPKGESPIQLYSLATPNGIKASIMLEELSEAGVLKYDAHKIDISKGEQFHKGFVDINPNSKIPCMLDGEGPDGKPIHLFESASIVLYLAEKYNMFLPSDPRLKAEVMNWIFWQMAGQGPMTGNFGHFMVYAPADKGAARDYGVARYGMEVQRLSDVLEKHLADGDKKYLVGNEYTIADIICFPWFHQLRTGYKHSSGIAAADFLSLDKYTHANAWADRIAERKGVQQGLQVCTWKAGSSAKPWLDDKKE